MWEPAGAPPCFPRSEISRPRPRTSTGTRLSSRTKSLGFHRQTFQSCEQSPKDEIKTKTTTNHTPQDHSFRPVLTASPLPTRTADGAHTLKTPSRTHSTLSSIKSMLTTTPSRCIAGEEARAHHARKHAPLGVVAQNAAEPYSNSNSSSQKRRAGGLGHT